MSELLQIFASVIAVLGIVFGVFVLINPRPPKK